RNDNFEAFVYRSDDYGRTWTRLGADLPAEPVNVVREDPKNPDIVYVGTDHGVYVSTDRGEHFSGLVKDFPAVPVHDLVVQAKSSELLIGTHGRSMYKVGVAQLQELTPEVLAQTLYVFEVSKRRASRSWGMKQAWQELKEPEMPVVYYAKTSGKVQWTVSTKDGLELQSGKVEAKAGLNTLVYNFDVAEDAVRKYEKSLEAGEKEKEKTPKLNKADTGKYYLQKGVYVLNLEKDGVRTSIEFVLE
ncbi:MAG: glycosyl hydrolase, partial [Saprospiraceae bacterium]|nr:glycosyl hydrolase [Saprospiraceae bacterium]